MSREKKASKAATESRASYYPIFLDLRGRLCVVVGGGRVAERKVHDLLNAGAEVKVVSPELTPLLEKFVENKVISHTPRRYRRGDLRGAFLVFAATSDPGVNRRVARDAGERPVNMADEPAASSFHVPASVERGPLRIAVSTSGASPAMARTIREELEEFYPEKTGRYIESLREKRQSALENIPDETERRAYLEGLASRAILERLRKKN